MKAREVMKKEKDDKVRKGRKVREIISLEKRERESRGEK